MDFCNLYTYNPLAPDYLNGLDPGTPEGYEDTYAEHAVNIVWATGGSTVTVALLFPWDFLARAVFATMDYTHFIVGAEATYNVMIIDPDGEKCFETRARGEILFGVGNAPMPIFPERFIPQGQSLTFEAQDETILPGQILQITFVGVRRRKVQVAA